MMGEWWVHMDFAGDHQVRRAEPEYDIEEWEGPFRSFSEMRRRILEAGQTEIEEIQYLQRVWREKRKAEVVIDDD